MCSDAKEEVQICEQPRLKSHDSVLLLTVIELSLNTFLYDDRSVYEGENLIKT